MADTVKIKINGKEYEASKDESILDVARRNGIYIPAICYSSRFGAIGACRVCVVEIVGMKKPMLSCAVKVKDGMEVLTDSEPVVEARNKVVWEWDKFHPLQCGVCDKSGECDLQDVNYDLNITNNPIEEEADPVTIPNRTIHYEWPIIHHDANLCIQCRRCVTICDKVVNFGILKLVKKDWGGKEIDTKDGSPLDCEFCGQCVSICPTGAMSSRLFKYKARAWEMEKVRTTCSFCSSGCQMDLNVKDNKVLRVTSEDDTPNRANLCNLGRFNYSVVETKNTISEYYVNKIKTNRDSAVSQAAKILSSYKPEEIAGIAGCRETLEEQYAFRVLFERALKSSNVDSFAATHIAKFYSVLPKGVSALNDFKDIEQSDLILSFGGDVANEVPRLDWQFTRAVKFLKKAKLITAYWRDTKVDTLGSIPLRYELGDEAKFANSLAAAIAKALSVSGIESNGSYEIAEDAIEAITSANSISFVIGQEALERANGEDVAKALANISLLLKDKVKVYVASKYNNSYGSLYAGLAKGFAPKGMHEDREFSLYKLPELVKNGKIKALVLLNADLFTVLSDEDAEYVLSNTDVILFDSYKSKTQQFAKVILPTPTFASEDGHYVNMEGKLNKVQHAIQTDVEPTLTNIIELSTKIGYSLPKGDVNNFCNIESISLETASDNYLSVDEQGFGFGSDIKGAVVFSKFRSGIFSSFGEGASIASSEPLLEMNPEDAQAFGLEDGSLAKVEGEGSLTLKVKIDEKMPKGYVAVPLWYDGYNAYNLSGSLNNLFSAKITKGE